MILTVSRFARWKSLDDVIRAFAGLPSPEAQLKIVGDGDDSLREELKALALQLGVRERVSFTGARSPHEGQGHYHEAEIFLSATSHEPFGIVFLEAMAAGLPIVAPRVGGIPELVPEGKAGLLVNPGDVKGLTEGVQRLLEDSALRERMGHFARQHAQECDLESHLYVFTDLYKELSKRGPRNFG